MEDNNYATNLLRSVSALLYMRNAMDLSQHLLGKNYAALSQPERALVDKSAYDMLAYFYGTLTPEFFVGHKNRIRLDLVRTIPVHRTSSQ